VTREFINGRQYRGREIRDAIVGGREFDDDALFLHEDGVFMPVREAFVPGQLYTWAQIRDHTWAPHGRPDDISPSTLFACTELASGLHEFTEVVEPSPHSLVPAESAQAAVEKLLGKGLALQDVAKAAGISLGAAQRAAAGNGFVRRATASALEAAANGKR
jgi:hypothetical protein